VEDASVIHFHIRWSNSKFDWEAFQNQTEADKAAKQLVRPGESFTIEQFDGECPQCQALQGKRQTEIAGAFERR
jgi:hypothetical protein